MPKAKDKKNKKDKKSKKRKDSIDWSLYPEGTTEIPNPHFTFGYDGFLLQNGDIYIGGFCAHNIGIAWREGSGVYITKDWHIYEGEWENDKLLFSEDTIIQFPCGVEYRGPVQENKYNGTGIYTLENKLPIMCSFKDNKPYGEVILTDPQNHLWKGNAEEDHVVLRPENHFYINMPYERGVGKRVSIRRSEEEIQNAKSIPSDASCLRELIFKKSTKTVNDFSSGQEIPGEDEEAISKLEVNCEKSFKPKSSMLKARSSNVSLLRTFLSKEYRNSVEPFSVFYPTVDTENKTEE